MGMQNVEDIYRLTPMQHGLLFHTLYAVEAGMYLEQFCYQLHTQPEQANSQIDIPALQQAWQTVLERYPILRTAFVWQGLDEPVQIVYQDVRLPWVVQDWRGAWRELAPAQQRAKLSAFLEHDRAQGFVLEEAPLMRCAVLRLSDTDCYFVWSFHHGLLDGWSCPLLLNDVFSSYASLRSGQPPMQQPTRPYRDYISWLQGQDTAAAQAYWQQVLDGFETPIRLPFDEASSPPRVQTAGETGLNGTPGAHREETFDELRTSLSAELTTALQDLARRAQVTQNTLVQAAWAALLSRYSGQTDIVFGSTVSGRNAELPGIESMVGLFVNTLPTRVQIEPTAPLLPWLKKLMASQADSQPYAYSSLVDMQGWSTVPRGTPLFETIVGFENYPQDVAHLTLPGGLTIQDFQVVERVHYPLTLLVVPGPQLALLLYYDQSRYQAGMIARLAEHLRNLLEAMVANPNQSLGELNMLSAAEQAQLLGEWSASPRRYPREASLVQLFEQQVGQTPDAIALTCLTGTSTDMADRAEDGQSSPTSLSYRTVNERANHLAQVLGTYGIGPERVVGVLMERSVELIVTLVAIAKTGAAYLPLDPRSPSERLSFTLRDAKASLLLTVQAQTVRPLAGTVEADCPVVCIDTEPAWHGTSSENHDLQGQPQNLAYIMYTSGSTGQPKGVAISQRSIVRLVQNTNFAHFGPDETFLLFAPPSFDASTLEVWAPLLNGGRLAIFPAEMPSLDELGQCIASQAITTMWLTAGLFHRLIEDQLPRLTSLRQLLAGGDVLSPPHVRKAIESLPGLTVINGYGPTENTTFTCCYPMVRCDQLDPSDRTVPIGRPIANTRVYILDAQRKPVPVGITGELYTAGDGLARGYSQRPALTADVFCPDPYAPEPGGRMYRTGDQVRFLPDGRLEFLGRIDRQVKIRGFRIEPGEIETQLVSHPAVREAAVVVRSQDQERQARQALPPQSDESSSDAKRLVAYVVADPDMLTTADPALSAQHVSGWKSVFDQHIYSSEAEARTAPADPLFNTTGWVSRYDGSPIPVQDMQVWASDIVTHIRSRAPQRVLEIGCGTGLLLFQLAPECERYYGTDFSQVALDYVEAQRQQYLPHLSQLQLEHRLADDFRGFADNTFDTVILSSIVQYFPDVEYLLNVLEGSLRVVRPGGFIFLGDIRNFALLETFHTALQLRTAPDALATRELKQAIHKHLAEENELLLDPAFFVQLRHHFPQISRVQVHLQRGQAVNELNQFRYHAVLQLGSDSAALPAESSAELPARLQLDGRRLRLEDIRQQLQTSRLTPDQTVVVTGLRNRRTAFETACVELLAGSSCPATVGQLRQTLPHSSAGIDPEALWQLGETLGYETQVCWSASQSGAPGAVDAVFIPPASAIPIETPLGVTPRPDRAWHVFANRPLQAVSRSQLVPSLRRYLETLLPDYMVPSAIVALDRMPLTQIGKLDRDALPIPDTPRSDQTVTVRTGRSPLEQVLVETFADLLGVEHLSIDDHFFELGGHSLLATSLVSRIRDILQLEIPLRKVFELPTVRALAGWLHDQQAQQDSRPLLPPIVPVSGDTPLPLSFAQQRLWFVERMGLSESAYHSPINLRLRGRLDRQALIRSLNELVARHEALRTAFLQQAGEPVQLVQPPATLEISVEELSPQSAHAPLDHALLPTPLQQLIDEENARRFDLAHGPLLRVKLLKRRETEHLLLLTFHHIVFDGWSMQVLVRELSELYHAYTTGRPPRLPALPVQYPAFAAWQRSQPFADSLDAQLTYWKAQLTDLTPLQLPIDYPRPAVQTVGGALHYFQIPHTVTQELVALSRHEGLTLFMTLLAAFQVLLYRYTGQTTITLGSPIANRNRGEIEGLIGFFVNTLVLSTRLEGKLRFSELLRRVRETALQAYANQDVPFERLVEELQPQRDLSRNPLVQVSFSLQQQEAMQPRFQLPGLDVSLLERSGITVRVDLELDLWQTADGLQGMCVYNTNLFAAATIARLCGHFQTLLTSIPTALDQPIAQLPLLSRDEIQEHILDWNNTRSAYPLDRCVHHVFEQWAVETPDAVALVYEDLHHIGTDLTLSYAKLNARANQLAHYLRALGLGPEVWVGICLERSPEMIIAVLATLKAGGAYVPLDPSYPQERLSLMLTDAAATLLISHSAIVDRLPTDNAVLICWDECTELIASMPTSNPPPPQLPPDQLLHTLAYVVYTSGSTGQPKGVLIDHRGLYKLQQAQAELLALQPHDRVLQFASFSFDAAVSEMVMAYARGAALVLTGANTLRAAPDLLAYLNRQAITVVTLPPSLLSVLSPQVPSLHVLLSAGEACSASIVNRWAPARRFFNAYGPSETSVCALMAACQSGAATPPPIGRPLANTRVYTLDADYQPVPGNLSGEVYIGGEGVARGYLNRPGFTAERFLPDPFTPHSGARMYQTGDVSQRTADGQLVFLGRLDNQIKIRGHRIEPGEIEALLKAHPEIADAVVVPVEGSGPGVAQQSAELNSGLNRQGQASPVEVWPSVAEYFVYDETLYYAMTNDTNRNAHYRAAIERYVPGRTVVDIGTGADAILARMCLEAGARHVYAIEYLADAYHRATRCIEALGLRDRITVFHGDATTLSLPEQVDVCVSEIVGAIGGSEGAAYIINNAQRFLKPGGRMIPELSITRIAAVSVPDDVLHAPTLDALTTRYAEKIFAQLGRRFDFRVCLKGVGTRHLISQSEVFEALDFRQAIPLETEHSISLHIERDARLDGFLVWLNLYTLEERCLDILTDTYCWIPVFLPVFDDGVSVTAGTHITATIARRLSDNGRNPDFQLRGHLVSPSGESQPFCYTSWHASPYYQRSPFYQRLFRASPLTVKRAAEAAVTAPDTRLLAYIVPSSACGQQPDPQFDQHDQAHQRVADTPAIELAGQHVNDWQALFNDTIAQHTAQPSAGANPLFNTAGWNDSYTGRPFPAEVMQRWAQDVAQQILASEPRRVLEIGCGTGMLLFQISPECEAYHGTDVSQTSLDYIRARIAEHAPQFAQVHLEHRVATDFQGLAPASFDAVVLNSVVQYFPHLNYFLDVIAGCIRLVRPGGMIFLGDIRNLKLLKTFHTSVALHRVRTADKAAASELNGIDLRDQIVRQIVHEDELFLDPQLFAALPDRHPEIRHVQLRLPDTTYPNELNKFRYQVKLLIDRPAQLATPSPPEPTPQNGQQLSLEDIRTQLAHQQLERWLVTQVPHRDVLPDVRAAERLFHDTPAASWQAVQEAKEGEAVLFELDRQAGQSARNGLAPQALRQLAQEYGYQAELFLSSSGPPGCIDVLFVRSDIAQTQPARAVLPSRLGQSRDQSQQPRVQSSQSSEAWQSYANNPLSPRRLPQLIAELKAHLATTLPVFMRPSAFVALDHMPLTPAGKIDRRALPSADTDQLAVETEAEEPISPLEETLVTLFADLLNLDRVSPHTHFFESGGHSLLATTLVSRIREVLDIEVPLQHVFELATPAELAAWITVHTRPGATPAPPLQALTRSGPIPLSFAQQRLWVLNQMGMTGQAYTVPIHMQLLGPLRRDVLQRSLSEIVRRHESLRTCFPTHGEEPVQHILPAGELAFPVVDLSDLSPTLQEATIRQLVAAENTRVFNLSAGPLLRATLLRKAPTEHVLLLSLHHIVSDGWSMGILVRELSALYTAFAANEASPLPELRLQYADFAVWQRTWLQGQVLEQQLGYWKAQLQDLPRLRLPRDHAPSNQVRGDFCYFRVADDTTARLKALSHRHSATVFMTLLAAFQILLSRYSGQQRIVVGSPIANRTRGETEELIGFFVNSLVLCTDLSGRPVLRQVVERVRQVTLEAYAHQDLPFERLVEELAPERQLSRNPLFQVMFVLQQRESVVPSFQLPELKVSLREPDDITVRFDLEIYMWPDGKGLRGAWLYNANVFEPVTIERFVSHYQTMLDALATDAEQPIHRVSLLSADEHQQIVYSWNATQTNYPQATIQTVFEAQAARQPDAVALVFNPDPAGGGASVSLSYSQLNTRANQVGHVLRQLGVGSPDTNCLVAVAMERSPELIVALLGILKAGGTYLPIDPSYPDHHKHTMLTDAQPHVLLTSTSSPPLETTLPCVRIDVEVDERARTDQINRAARITLVSAAGPEAAAYVNYTSGSTGQPKGIVIPHRAVLRLVFNTNYIHLSAADRIAHSSNVSFDAATFEIWGALLHGGTLVIVPHETALAPHAYARVLREQAISTLFLTPVLFNQVVDEIPTAFATVRNVLVGGEAFDVPHARQVLQHPPERLLNAYGPTESTTFAAWYQVKQVAETATSIPIGKPLANTRLYILDDHLAPVPIGAPGELWIGGDGVAHGYLKRSQLTAEKFVPDPYTDTAGARMYRTGDLARFSPDGNIEFLGRLDDQIKLRGFRIELGEIEAQLSSHTAVRESAVIVRETATGDKRLAAYIVLEPDYVPAGGDIDELAAGQVAAWERVFDEHIYTQPDQPNRHGQSGQLRQAEAQTTHEQSNGRGEADRVPPAAVADLPHDPLFNTAGWRSSYDGTPISQAEMRVWAQDIVSQVLAHTPRRVLELGCGTGMLLFQIAPACEAYTGVDISQVSLDYVQQQLDIHPQQYAHVTLERRSADTLADLAAESFDTIILSSTIQYFPSLDYLLDVLEGSLRLLRPGGVIFLADVRSLPLLEVFHASVQLFQAEPDLPTAELCQRIRHSVLYENELVVDPALFAALPARFPQIGAVQTALQRGQQPNELNRFRYSVRLQKNAPTATRQAADVWRPGHDLSLAHIRHSLTSQRPEQLGFRQLPNARLYDPLRAAALVAQAAASPDAFGTVQTIRRALHDGHTRGEPVGLDPDALYELGAELGYHTTVSWSADGPVGSCDVLFVRSDCAEGRVFALPPTAQSAAPRDWQAYTNNPSRARLAPELIREVRDYLATRLPDFMLPADFTVLERLPLTATGKLDRRALPAPDTLSTSASSPEAGGAARTPAEQTLSGFFIDLLGLERVGIQDSFFDLGGHSLLATRLVSRIRDRFQVELPLRQIFESPTVAALASLIAQQRIARATPDELLTLLEELESLPEEEAKRLLDMDLTL